MNNNNDMTILLVSCDAYSDLWTNFFLCKKKYWPDCPYKTILANNELKYNVDNIEVINCGKNAAWSDRTRIALQKIKTKYICFLLEDFYICKQVDTESIKQALVFMENHNIKYYKLDSFSKIKTKDYNNLSYLKEIPPNLQYGISLLASIWNREFFLEKLGHTSYNAWQFEIDRNSEASANINTQSQICCIYDNRNLLHICHMVIKGKYIPPAVKFFKKKGYTIDTSVRKIMSKKEWFIQCAKSAMSLPSRKFPIIKKIVKKFGILYVE